MRKLLFALSLLLIAIVPQREPLRAQATGGEKTNTSPQSGTAPPIRSTTRLVQVSVVVTDKKGEPVTGLGKQDFVVSDQGKPQQIAFFSAETPPIVGTLTSKLPPNVFTNRFDLTGQYPGAVTVVLFDSLNTPVQDQAWVRNQVIQFLKNLQPRDHVAIYALTTDLLLLHEFTQDSAALVAAANAFQPKEQALHDASHPDYFNVTALAGDKSWAAFQAAVNQTDARIAEQYKLRSAEITAHALEAISNHLATIPGRKNLVWVSGSFPANILVEAIGSIDRQNESTQKYSVAAARALNRANIAVYPVDAGGIAPNVAMDPSRRGGDIGDLNSSLYCADCVEEAPGTSSGMNARQNTRDTERMFADATGGLAFYGSNDIRGAMKRSFDDGRYAYTIGFYPDHGQWNGKFRNIKVHASVSGVQLRYRNGYFAETEHTDSEKQAKQELQQAAMSPLNATGLGLIVSGKLSGPAGDRKVELHVALDPKQLQLRDDDRYRKGILDLYFVQRDAQGETVAAESQRIGLNLEEKQYESLAQAGLVLARHLTISPQASELRVLVRDADSHALGSVTVPVLKLLGSTPVAPAKMPVPDCTNTPPSDKFAALNCEYPAVLLSWRFRN
jgi:VWFA-related protein